MDAVLSHMSDKAIAGFVAKSKEQSTLQFLMDIIPNTVIGAFAQGEILQVLFFAVLFAFALQALGERGRVQGLEQQRTNSADQGREAAMDDPRRRSRPEGTGAADHGADGQACRQAPGAADDHPAHGIGLPVEDRPRQERGMGFTAQLTAWQSTPLDTLDLVGLLIDGVHLGDHCLIVALGIYPQLLFKMTDLPVTQLVSGMTRALGLG